MLEIETKEFQKLCKNLLDAVDTRSTSTVSEVLELKSSGNSLLLNITNEEYYVSTKMDFNNVLSEFKAVVNASLFLGLVSKITTTSIGLDIDGNSLVVKSNGEYKFPMIYEGTEMVNVPEIVINNPVNELPISKQIIDSILKFNLKELKKTAIETPLQNQFYIDENGCITFGVGACVNNFTLDNQIKLLFPLKIVKLLKLFNGEIVNLTLGYDPVSESIIQTKVYLDDGVTKLCAILSTNNNLLNSFPVIQIRERANYNYPNSLVVDKDLLIESLSRLSLFNKGTSLFTPFEVKDGKLIVYDCKKVNKEIINLSTVGNDYQFTLNTKDLDLTLKTFSEKYLTIKYGDSRSIVVDRDNVKDVIPECKVMGE